MSTIRIVLVTALALSFLRGEARAAGGYFVGGKIYLPPSDGAPGKSSGRRRHYCETSDQFVPATEAGEILRGWMIDLRRVEAEREKIAAETALPASGYLRDAFSALRVSHARSNVERLTWRMAQNEERLEALRPNLLRTAKSFFQNPDRGFHDFVTMALPRPDPIDFKTVLRHHCTDDEDY